MLTIFGAIGGLILAPFAGGLLSGVDRRITGFQLFLLICI